ncbi:kinesin-like protein KIN-7O [Orussus abietinus]|uniref:kinesin-like protein KIN-7O n=1 Tax=Orussus abietinus TaxID=222816 RepID=UPI000626789D|nr:kinesin-like protein KIN-7O [Orussus abietinus]XP_012283034.1 kinesin-like protein KIN-7O [Orussus abietinus]XP_012283035.1 kinesin-like protein KIN-7O [Orussus abietinus]
MSNNNIQVIVKARPALAGKNKSLPAEWKIEGNTIVPVNQKSAQQTDKRFVHYVRAEETNKDVFDIGAKHVIEEVIKGFNGTIITYGQKLAGKTHIMMGTKESPGILQYSIDYIFERIENIAEQVFLIRVSCVEICNNKINDLLKANSTDLHFVKINEKERQIKCHNQRVDSPEDIYYIIEKIMQDKCKMAEENEQERSAHTIFQITIGSIDSNENSRSEIQLSQLSLVDLAALEGANATRRHSDSRNQTNESVAFDTIIKALCRRETPWEYIQYNRSKLTRALQSALGGNSITTIVCPVILENLTETRATLNFAFRVNSIQNYPRVNKYESKSPICSHVWEDFQELMKDMEHTEGKMDIEQSIESETLDGSIVNTTEEFNESDIPSPNTSPHEEKRRISFRGSRYSSALPTIKENEKVASVESPQHKVSENYEDIEELSNSNVIIENETQNRSYQTIPAISNNEDVSTEITAEGIEMDLCPKEHTYARQTENVNTAKDYHISVNCNECVNLREEVKALRVMQSQFKVTKEENITLQATEKMLRMKIKSLKTEINDYTYELDTIKRKHKIREEELVTSLKDAVQENESLIAELKMYREISTPSLSENRSVEHTTSKLNLKKSEDLREELERENTAFLKQQELMQTQLADIEKGALRRTNIDGHDEFMKYQLKIALSCIECLLDKNHECLMSQNHLSTEKRQEIALAVKKLNKSLTGFDGENFDALTTLTELKEILAENTDSVHPQNEVSSEVKNSKAFKSVKFEGMKLRRSKEIHRDAAVDETTHVLNDHTNRDIDINKAEMSFNEETITVTPRRRSISSKLNATNDSRYETTQFFECSDDSVHEMYDWENSNIDTSFDGNKSIDSKNACSLCGKHKKVKDFNETLKFAVMIADYKLHGMQLKFNQECMDLEILKQKVNEDLHVSMDDSNLSVGASDEINVADIEKKIWTLNNRFNALKKNHDELSVLYNEKLTELSNLYESSFLDTSMSQLNSSQSSKDEIGRIQQQIEDLDKDLQQIRDDKSKFSAELQIFKSKKKSEQTRINSLKSKIEQQEMELSNEKKSVLMAENKIKELSHKVLSLEDKSRKSALRIQNLVKTNSKLETERNTANMKNEEFEKKVVELNKAITELRKTNAVLSQELVESKKKKEGFVECCKHLIGQIDTELTSKISERHKAEEDSHISTGKDGVIKDDRPPGESERIVSNVKHEDNDGLLCNIKKLITELMESRNSIIKELCFFEVSNENNELSQKSLPSLLNSFINIIMSKQRKIQKISDDRINELQTTVNKLQSNLQLLNDKDKDVESVSKLLEEKSRENNLLKEKVQTYEAECSNLQAEIDKLQEVLSRDKSILTTVQERENQKLQTIKCKEEEISKLTSEGKKLEEKIQQLITTLQTYKTKCTKFEKKLQDLQKNEEEIKNKSDAKTVEIAKYMQEIKTVTLEYSDLEERYKKLEYEYEENELKVQEITDQLKRKCDLLTEYKTKVEMIMPDYDTLKREKSERISYDKKYKEELETLKAEIPLRIQELAEKLSAEEIKNINLNKTLSDKTNTIKALQAKLEDFMKQYQDLQQNNLICVEKLKNSISKTQVNLEMKELRDDISSLQKKLDESNIKIDKLKEDNHKLSKDRVELIQARTTLLTENEQLKISSVMIKKNHLEMLKIQKNNEELLQAKNGIALELNEVKLSVARKDKELTNCQKEIEKQKAEIDSLNKKLKDFTLLNEERNKKGCQNCNMIRKSENNEKQIEILRKQLHVLTTKLENMVKTCEKLQLENDDLRDRIRDESKTQKKNCSNLKGQSLENDRRQQRKDLFNQKRQLEMVCGLSSCRCEILVAKIQELEVDIATKDGKIKALELQIESENFSYQKKCRTLETSLQDLLDKNNQLKDKVKDLQKDLIDSCAKDCKICRTWQNNKRDQLTQCTLEAELSPNTTKGNLDDSVKAHLLEKETAVVKNLHRMQVQRIKQLEKKLLGAETSSENELTSKEEDSFYDALSNTADESDFM